MEPIKIMAKQEKLTAPAMVAWLKEECEVNMSVGTASNA